MDPAADPYRADSPPCCVFMMCLQDILLVQQDSFQKKKKCTDLLWLFSKDWRKTCEVSGGGSARAPGSSRSVCWGLGRWCRGRTWMQLWQTRWKLRRPQLDRIPCRVRCSVQTTPGQLSLERNLSGLWSGSQRWTVSITPQRSKCTSSLNVNSHLKTNGGNDYILVNEFRVSYRDE